MESCPEYTWCQLLLIGMSSSGPSPAAGLTIMETSWTFTLVGAMRFRRVDLTGLQLSDHPKANSSATSLP